jgi:hypothetical protein
VLRERERVVVKHREDGTPVERERPVVRVLHTDLVGDAFWEARPEILL